MKDYSALLNILICAFALISGVIIFFTAYLIDYPDNLDFNKTPSTSYGFLFWLMWWISLLIAYFLLPEPLTSLHPITLSILDFGDLCLLGFVICYCSGDADFSWKRLSLLLITLMILILYYTIMYGALRGGYLQANPLFAVWLFSPSAVLANVALLMLGWAFLVRWGLKALPLFFVTSAYAWAQLPAYIAAFVVLPSEYKGQFASVQGFNIIQTVFPYLALGKIVLAFYPLTLFLSPEGSRPDTKKAKYWPSKEQFNLHPNIRRILLWVLTTLVSLSLGAIIKDHLVTFARWLGLL